MARACVCACAYLRDPEGTHHVSPARVVRLLEGAPLVGAEGAVHGAAGRLQAAAAQPLALGDVGHAVALLVHRQVAHVAEQDHVAVLTLAVIADAADGVFVDEGAGVGLMGGEKRRGSHTHVD